MASDGFKDLLAGLQMFKQGVQEVQVRRAFEDANKMVEQVKATETNQAKQRAALFQISQGITARMAGLGLAPAQAAQYGQLLEPEKEPLYQTTDQALLNSTDPDVRKRAEGIMSAKSEAELAQIRETNRARIQIAAMDNQAKGAAAPKPLTDIQANAAGFFDRASAAEGALKNLAKTYTGTEIRVPLPNRLKSEDRQVFEQTQRDFISAVLRKESGAAISDQEYENEGKKYFPQPGDSEGVLKRKEAARKIALNSLKRAAGPALQQQQESAEPAQADWSKFVK